MTASITIVRSGDHVTITDGRVIVKVHSDNLAPLLTSLGAEEAADIAGSLLSTLGVTVHDLPGRPGSIVKGAQRDRRMPAGVASVRIDTPLGLTGILTLQTHESVPESTVSVGEAIAFVVDADYPAIGRAVSADERNSR